ncbi:MAG: hypothetical protein NTZ68_02160 [Candidatus Dependentiae bacterium]|nr:hypothetical protein [Candidatus Dependentiae bacterium]
MKIKVLLMVISVFGVSKVNAVPKQALPVVYKKIVDMAGVADLVRYYGFKVHKCSHTELHADRKDPKVFSLSAFDENIKIDLLPSMLYIIRTKHEIHNNIYDCGEPVEEVLDVHMRTSIVDGFDRLVSAIEDYLDGR